MNGAAFTAVTSGSASVALALNVGSNAINVKVTAEDGTTVKTYTVTVCRGPSSLPTLTNTSANTCFGTAAFSVSNAGNATGISWYNGASLANTAGFVSSTSGTTVAGGNYGGYSANQLYYPQGIFVDASNTVYIANRSAHTVQKWVAGLQVVQLSQVIWVQVVRVQVIYLILPMFL